MSSIRSFVILFILVTWVVAAPTVNHTGGITGRVVDAATGEIIVGAGVFSDSLRRGGATDIDGHYLIWNLPPGKHRFWVKALGYDSSCILVQVFADSAVTVPEVKLEAEIINLEEPQYRRQKIVQKTGTIHGYVVEKSSRKPVVGCAVRIQSTKIGTSTGINGTFILTDLAPGMDTLRLDGIGYRSLLCIIPVKPDTVTMLDLRMPQDRVDWEHFGDADDGPVWIKHPQLTYRPSASAPEPSESRSTDQH